MTRFAILVSGRGTNMAAIVDFWAQGGHGYPTDQSEPVVVIADRPDAGGLALAESAGLPTEVVNYRELGSRAAFGEALVAALVRHRVDALVLAGFMRVLGGEVVARFPDRILNTHPSLLPSFPGLDATGQAISAGVQVSGCTIHLVDAGVDTGPIIAQGTVPVLADDTSDRLQARIQQVEYALYPRVIAKIFAGEYTRRGPRVDLEGGHP